MIFASEIYTRAYQTMKDNQEKWFKQECESQVKSLLIEGYSTFDLLKHIKIYYPAETIGKLLIDLEVNGFILHQDNTITFNHDILGIPSIIQNILDKLLKEQEEWLINATNKEITILISLGLNPSEIVDQFKIKFPIETFGKPLIDFNLYGYTISDSYIITIRDDLK